MRLSHPHLWRFKSDLLESGMTLLISSFSFCEKRGDDRDVHKTQRFAAAVTQGQFIRGCCKITFRLFCISIQNKEDLFLCVCS